MLFAEVRIAVPQVSRDEDFERVENVSSFC